MSILDLASEAEDVVDTNAGGGDFKPPRPGVALLRLCSYIELGMYEGEWKGKKKQNKKCIVEFELVHDDHKIINKEGVFIGYHKIYVRLNKSGHVKSKYMALFNRLNYDGKVKYTKDTIPALSKFLGQPFLGTVVHNAYKEKIYANLDKDGDFLISAPRTPVNDAATGLPTGEYKDLVIPEMNVKPRLFLWESPGMSNSGYHTMWESIYIDGDKDDGTSKNWIQNTIKSEENIALPGSIAEQLFVEDGELSNLGSKILTEDPSLA